ncbi:hypothetical protein D9M71_523330 [compost metagenome]
MVVGQQVALGAHDHRRAEARLHAPLARQVVAEEAAKLRVVEQRVARLVHHLGGVQVGHRRCGQLHRVAIGHRAQRRQAEGRGLAQFEILLVAADPLGKQLDHQQGQQEAGDNRPAEKTQRLVHRESLRLRGRKVAIKVAALYEAGAREAVANCYGASPWPLP